MLYLVSEADCEIGLSFALTETPKTGFVATRPNYLNRFFTVCEDKHNINDTPSKRHLVLPRVAIGACRKVDTTKPSLVKMTKRSNAQHLVEY